VIHALIIGGVSLEKDIDYIIHNNNNPFYTAYCITVKPLNSQFFSTKHPDMFSGNAWKDAPPNNINHTGQSFQFYRDPSNLTRRFIHVYTYIHI